MESKHLKTEGNDKSQDNKSTKKRKNIFSNITNKYILQIIFKHLGIKRN